MWNKKLSTYHHQRTRIGLCSLFAHAKGRTSYHRSELKAKYTKVNQEHNFNRHYLVNV